MVVLYHPDAGELDATLQSLAPQCRTLYLIDNSTPPHPLPPLPANAVAIAPGRNLGIGAGQNTGIARALEAGADWVLLSDQDTVYPPGTVEGLLAIATQEARLGAIGPAFAEANSGARHPFIRLSGWRVLRLWPATGVVEASQIIASGALLSAAALRAVGPMAEALFIDWVDIEWCWRARAAGWRVLGTADVTIRHRLGDRAVGLGRGSQRYPIRRPARSYTIIRNGLHLALRHPALGRAERLGIALRALRYWLGITVLARDWRHIPAGLRAVGDAVRKRLGPYPGG